MREVFISYKSNDPQLGNNDGTVAFELCEKLEAAGITCWIAPRNIEAGKRYAAAIMDALKSCKVMVVVFSRYANESEHIANEVDTAFARKIDIIPFNIDGAIPNDEFGYYLRRMQWINAIDNYQEKIPELISALYHKLGKTSDYKDDESPSIEPGEVKMPSVIAIKDSNLQPFMVNGVSFNMIHIEGGAFQMGATEEQGEDFWDSEMPVHNVELTGYAIGQTEVTQELWVAVMGSNPSNNTSDLLNPVECVSWNDCQKFIKKLNALTRQHFRIPTEAEWEFAARGGNKSQHFMCAGSSHIEEVAWFSNNSYGSSHSVATKAPNELGLYDMNGNVWEWCHDWFDRYQYALQQNPTGPSSGEFRVIRGGCWNGPAKSCRVSNRWYNSPSRYDRYLGLRLALTPYNERNSWRNLNSAFSSTTSLLDL